MARFGHGVRSKTRKKLTKDYKKQGITKYLRKFKIGEKVAIKIDPSSQNFPHPRYHGLIGEVINTRGRSYVIKVKAGGTYKTIISTPEHIKKL
ncbi:MAG: 50S ribosomal protein L21e [Candidatus Aenigmarchaeota archaeon ex4484_56]|nr:MAG: 50S ribosomal protein L21e [Candidatus Aenigmarchaeota archaeon ex4484_56]